MGNEEERGGFLTQVKKACAIGQKLRELGIRKYGVIRIDSATGVDAWSKDPAGNTKKIAATFREAGHIAEGFGERLAAEGEICWGGMHSWRRNVELLEQVAMPKTVGFQADMAHTMLFTMGFNAPEDRLLPDDFDWSQGDRLAAAYREMARALRPWTFDFHVAQNDGTASREKARTTRPESIARQPILTASLTSFATPGPGCAMTTAIPRTHSHISAGMAACSRTP